MTVKGPVERKENYIGLSTDTKPTVGVSPGASFYESNTGKRFIYTGSAWVRE